MISDDLTVNHPAKFSKGMVHHFAEIIERHYANVMRDVHILDPFAGTGLIHKLRLLDDGFKTFGVEIEQEWADLNWRTIHGDSRYLSLHFAPGSMDVVCTSPTYGNRMADHHNARDDSKRLTYTHRLGRALTPGNSGAMQWGDDYQELHKIVWKECHGVMVMGGLFILNISDHIRKGEVMNVSGWHTEALEDLGFKLIEPWFFPTRGMGYGANARVRTPGEYILVYRKEQ